MNNNPHQQLKRDLGYVCHKLNNIEEEEDAVHRTHHEEEEDDIVQFDKNNHLNRNKNILQFNNDVNVTQ
eukprot:4634054-Amphidinium_carterae.4